MVCGKFMTPCDLNSLARCSDSTDTQESPMRCFSIFYLLSIVHDVMTTEHIPSANEDHEMWFKACAKTIKWTLSQNYFGTLLF